MDNTYNNFRKQLAEAMTQSGHPDLLKSPSNVILPNGQVKKGQPTSKVIIDPKLLKKKKKADSEDSTDETVSD